VVYQGPSSVCEYLFPVVTNREIINNMDSNCIHISHYEVTTAIAKLNNNAILEHGYIPPQFLSGIITPVYKKGRDATDFSNYRGITVSCTLGKILEHIILNRIEHLLQWHCYLT
jgi:hypothetical protein